MSKFSDNELIGIISLASSIRVIFMSYFVKTKRLISQGLYPPVA